MSHEIHRNPLHPFRRAASLFRSSHSPARRLMARSSGFRSVRLRTRLARNRQSKRKTEELMMPHEHVTIRTRDGNCPCHVMLPANGGPWPGVIFCMDAGGVGPAVVDMAQRLADDGYVVLLPDLFYRYGPYGPFVPKEVLAGGVRAILGPLMATTGNDKAAERHRGPACLLRHAKRRCGPQGRRGRLLHGRRRGVCRGGSLP